MSIWLFQAPFSLVSSAEAAMGLVSLTCLCVSHYVGMADLIHTHVSTCHSPALSFPTSSPSYRGLCCDLTLKGSSKPHALNAQSPAFGHSFAGCGIFRKCILVGRSRSLGAGVWELPLPLLLACVLFLVHNDMKSLCSILPPARTEALPQPCLSCHAGGNLSENKLRETLSFELVLSDTLTQ